MTPADVPPDSAPRPPRVSLDAVAREAGVSLATASRALSGRAVRAHLQDRVDAAARRLGYRPDLAAQAVARGTTKTVALIVDYLRSPFGVEITRGVVDAASDHDLVVHVTGSETHPGDLLEMIASVRALRPQSLVLATGRVQDPDIRDELVRVLEAYEASGGSVAIVDGRDLPFASCSFDETTAAYALGEVLFELGYRRPLVFNSSSERTDLAGRTDALIRGLAQAGIQRDQIRLAELPSALSSTLGDDRLLELNDADVVLCVEGAVLPAVYRHIRAQGLRVGSDVAVTAFGQYGIAEALRPHLTTVMLPLRRAGALALEHALTDTEGAHLSLPCNLRVRASTPQRHSAGGAARRRSEPRNAEVRPSIRGTVGVVLPALSAADTGALAHELFKLADADGTDCALVAERTLLHGKAEDGSLGGFEALLVWGDVSATLSERIVESGVRCVVVGRSNASDALRLSIEAAEGMQRLLEHLDSLGHTQISYLRGDEHDPLEAERRWGIDLFSATHGDATINLTSYRGDAPVESVLEGGTTAVIAHDDVLGVRLMQQLRSAGIQVPGDVSVAGFGGGWAGELSVPKLTTVVVDVSAAARAAWRILGAADDAGESRSLRAPLKLRASTGSPDAG